MSLKYIKHIRKALASVLLPGVLFLGSCMPSKLPEAKVYTEVRSIDAEQEAEAFFDGFQDHFAKKLNERKQDIRNLRQIYALDDFLNAYEASRLSLTHPLNEESQRVNSFMGCLSKDSLKDYFLDLDFVVSFKDNLKAGIENRLSGPKYVGKELTNAAESKVSYWFGTEKVCTQFIPSAKDGIPNIRAYMDIDKPRIFGNQFKGGQLTFGTDLMGAEFIGEIGKSWDFGFGYYLVNFRQDDFRCSLATNFLGKNAVLFIDGGYCEYPKKNNADSTGIGYKSGRYVFVGFAHRFK